MFVVGTSGPVDIGGAFVAKQVITVLTDDLDGGDADGTVEFGIDGVTYTVDLSAKNAEKLRGVLSAYIQAAYRVGRTGSARGLVPRVRSGRENQAIREWAAKDGWAVSGRGRIPDVVVEAYKAKH